MNLHAACRASLALTLGACSSDAPKAERAEPIAPDAHYIVPAAAADVGDGEPEVVLEDDPIPTEPSVILDEPGKGPSKKLAARTAGTTRRVVVQIGLTTGRSKKLYLPRVRLAGEVTLDGIDDEGSRYRWIPQTTSVLVAPDDEGVDREFLAGFEAALAPASPPAAVALTLDRFDAAGAWPWPADTTNPHAAQISSAQRLALSHLAVPVPALELTEGSQWTVTRKIDLLGIPAWQVLTCTAKKIEGTQLEITANARYFGIEPSELQGEPLGLKTVASLSGRGKLKARFDLATATPIDMQLRGTLDIRETDTAKSRRFGFEVRADEDYLAHPDPRVKLAGQFTQGGLITGVVPPGTKIRFNKRKVKVSPEGDFVVGFGRDAPARALLSLVFADGAPERHILHVADREFEPEAIDGLPPEMVDLDRETRKALSKSRQQIKKVRGKASDTPYFRDGFIWPMKGKLTSTYGRKRILNGKEQGFHWGVDVAGPVGRKVRAPAAGVVVLANKDVPLSGNLLILDHGHGLTSSFLHLKEFRAKEGDVVKSGQVIATSGNSGRSTGPHLDWRMNLFDTRVDPQTLVTGLP